MPSTLHKETKRHYEEYVLWEFFQLKKKKTLKWIHITGYGETEKTLPKRTNLGVIDLFTYKKNR